MAVSLLLREVSDLCLGKPSLKPISAAATVADALTALKKSGESFICVWDFQDWRCVGKVSMVDVICFMCKDENLLLPPSSCLEVPLSRILPEYTGIVMHLEPSASILEAIDLILQGAQNLVIPIKTRLSRRKQLQKSSNTTSTILQNGKEFCWITQEDIIRFLLSSIGLFSPIPSCSISSLNIISTKYLSTNYYSPASSALLEISLSMANQTSTAVCDGNGILIGEISPFTLANCDETVAAAILTLSSGDLMAYIDWGGPPEDLVKMVKMRLSEMNLETILEEFFETDLLSSSSSSEGEEEDARRRGISRSLSYNSSKVFRRSEAIVCHPRSSLVAVMIQAIAHRVNYVWVVEDDCSLVGIVTFCDMLRVFRDHLGNVGL